MTLKLPDDEELLVQTSGAMFSYSLEKHDDAYILYSLQSFDYELNQRLYAFTIVSNTKMSATVVLKIQNIDDEPPTLTSPQCSFLVSIVMK